MRKTLNKSQWRDTLQNIWSGIIYKILRLSTLLIQGKSEKLLQPKKSKETKCSVQDGISSVQSLGHVQLCNSMNHSMPGLPVHHQLPESTQTHVHWVSDAIQPSHPLSSPSPPALNLSQHQCLFKWVSSLHQVAKVLEFQLQDQSFQWTVKIHFLWDWLLWSPYCPRDSQESSPASQFKSIVNTNRQSE